MKDRGQLLRDYPFPKFPESGPPRPRPRSPTLRGVLLPLPETKSSAHPHPHPHAAEIPASAPAELHVAWCALTAANGSGQPRNVTSPTRKGERSPAPTPDDAARRAAAAPALTPARNRGDHCRRYRSQRGGHGDHDESASRMHSVWISGPPRPDLCGWTVRPVQDDRTGMTAQG